MSITRPERGKGASFHWAEGPEARPSPSASSASSRLCVLLPHRISLLKSPHFPPHPVGCFTLIPIPAAVKDT